MSDLIHRHDYMPIICLFFLKLKYGSYSFEIHGVSFLYLLKF